MSVFKSLRPILWTENIDETILFYTGILGFTLEEKNENWGWASLSRNTVSLMISKPNAHYLKGSIGFSGTFYFEVQQVDYLWEEFKHKTKICYPVENFEWMMREFAIFDNNGYILQFGEEIAS